MFDEKCYSYSFNFKQGFLTYDLWQIILLDYNRTIMDKEK